MKYIVLIGDGMADEPCDRLEGKTPMEAAQKPYMNYLASMGVNGLVDTVPEGMTPKATRRTLPSWAMIRAPIPAAAVRWRR